jgi:hypothetical protein
VKFTRIAAGAVVATLISSAMAAGFDINTAQATLADTSTGQVSVDDCTAGIRLDVLTGAYDTVMDDWKVAGVRVKTTDRTLSTACAGFTIEGVLSHVDAQGRSSFTYTDQATIATTTQAELTLPVTGGATVWSRQVLATRVKVDEPNLVPPVIKPVSTPAQILGQAQAPNYTTPFWDTTYVRYVYGKLPRYTTVGVDKFGDCPDGTDGYVNWMSDVTQGHFFTVPVRLVATYGPKEIVLLDPAGKVVAKGGPNSIVQVSGIPTGSRYYVGAMYCTADASKLVRTPYVSVGIAGMK